MSAPPSADAIRRGGLLLAFHAAYPYPVAKAFLEQAQGPHYRQDFRLLEQDVALLMELHLLAPVEVLKHQPVDGWKLTAMGMLACSGDHEVPGIHVVSPAARR